MEKLCSCCDQLLPSTDFHKNNSKKDNLHDWCKTCRREAYKNPLSIKKKNKDRWDKESTINILSKKDIIYLAGFFDGEGTIVLYKNYTTYIIKIAIANTFPGIIDWIVLKVGYGKVYKAKKQCQHHKDAWTWSLHGSRAINLLKQLYPYLKVKKLQAEVAFDFSKTIAYPGQSKLSDKILVFREGLRAKMSSLNN